MVGVLSYLINTVRLEISMAVHQCTRFSIDSKLHHEKYAKWVVKYLVDTKHMGTKVSIDS